MVDPFLAAAWEDIHAANEALGWFVGQPAYEPHRIVPWSMYAFRSHRAGDGWPAAA